MIAEEIGLNEYLENNGSPQRTPTSAGGCAAYGDRVMATDGLDREAAHFILWVDTRVARPH
jgi:hypothetical protein